MASSAITNSPSLIFRLALRELRSGLGGFYILVMCIALGVAAMAGVAATSRAIVDGMSAQSEELLGGDVSFSLVHREATEIERAFIGEFGRVSKAATLRGMLRRSDGKDQALINIKAVDAFYPLIGTVEFEGTKSLANSFTRADDKYGIIVAPILLERLDLKTGDPVNLGTGQFYIAGVLTKEPDQLTGSAILGPRVLMSEEALATSGLVQPGSLVTWHYRVDFADGVVLSALMQRARDLHPDAGWRIRSKGNAANGLRRNLNRFSQFLSLVGLAALCVGGVGVANAIQLHIGRSQKVIAIYKCLGAGSGLVFRIYFVQALILASIGIFAGLVLGAIIPHVITLFAGSAIPIQPVIFPVKELGIAALYGYLSAILFALWPLARTGKIPAAALFRDQIQRTKVRPGWKLIAVILAILGCLVGLALILSRQPELTMVFLGSLFAAFVLLRVVGSLIMWVARHIPKPRQTTIRLALASLSRNGSLTPSVVLSLGLGITLIVALTLIDGNLRQQLTGSLPDRAPGFFFVDVQNTELDKFKAHITNLEPEAELFHVPMLRGRIKAINGILAEDWKTVEHSRWALRGDRGITYSDVLPESSSLLSGEWWSEGYSGPPLVSIESGVAEGLGLKLGDVIEINVLGRRMSAKIANFRKVDWDSLGINFVMVFSANTFKGAPHTHLATLSLPDDKSNIENEARILRETTKAFPAVTSIRVKDALNRINDLVTQLAWGVRGISSLALLASMLVLGGALAASQAQRIYDAVILKSLGATRKKLVQLFLLEYAIIGVVTGLFGIVAGSLIAWTVLSAEMTIPFTLLWWPVISGAVIALVLTLGFGLLGTWRVLGQSSMSVLRAE